MTGRILNTILFILKNPTAKTDLTVRCHRDIKCGKNVIIGHHCVILKNTTFADNVLIGAYSFLHSLELGSDSQFESNVRIVGSNGGKIKIGRQCYIGVFNVLDNSNDITIGNFVHIAGPSTGLWTHSSAQMCLNSVPLNDPDRNKFRPTAPIIIEDNVYIGGNCTIYPGVTIRHHAVIAPNSAVTKNVEAFTMVGGVPAKLIKRLLLEDNKNL
jgi:acetyltransferase-like isoleucine patch superfamily enzyme